MAYTFEGQQYPAVSTILGQLDKSGALMGWALNCYEARLKELLEEHGQIDLAMIEQAKREYKLAQNEALDIGTQVHDAIEKYIKTGKDLSGDLKPEVANGFIAFLEWESENVRSWIDAEVKTVDPEAGYGGTYDAMFFDKQDKVVMVDFKTSKAIYDEYWMQLAAYRSAREGLWGRYTIEFERGEGANFDYYLDPVNIDYVSILRLDKHTGMPEYKIRDKKRSIYDYMAFEKLVEFYYHHKKRRLKNNSIVKEIWR